MKQSQLSIFVRELEITPESNMELVDTCPELQCPYRKSGVCPKILTVDQVPIKRFLDFLNYFDLMDPYNRMLSIKRVDDGGVAGYDYGIFLASNPSTQNNALI